MTLKNTRSGYRSALSKVYTDVSQQCDENTLLNELLHAREIHQKIVALQKEIIDNEKEQKGRNIEESWLVEHTQYFSLLENLILDKLRELSQPPEEDQDDLPKDQSKSTGKKTIPGAHCSTSSGTSSSEFGSIMALVERLSAQHADTTKQQNELIKTLVSGRSTKHKPFKLPPLQIPKFDGTYKSWTSFRDLFIAAVHENDDLSPGQKHQQLMGYLMPEASSCIRHIQISDANYEKAWSLLKQRYEKPYNIVADHIQTFLSIPHVKSVDKKTLRYAHSTAVEVTNALDAMHVTSRDPWLIHMLNERLDPETRKLWEDKRKYQSPTWDDYLQFLGKRCDVIEACGDDTPSTSAPIKKSSPPVKKKSTTLIATQSSKCTCCNKDGHPLYRCSMFLQKTPSERLEVVKKAKLCRNCINSSHLTNDCDRSPCRQCGIRHNSLLHDAFAAQPKPPATITSNNSVPQTQTNPQPGSIVSQSPASDSRVNLPQPVTQSTSVGTPFSINYSSASSSTKVFLSTCVVNVMDSRRIVHQCRAVLDSGAQQSMMTDNLRERLQLRCSPDSTVLVGFNNRSSRVKGRSELLVLSSTLDNSFEFNCLVVPQVTGKLPNFQVDPHAVQIPSQITLSDPNWCVESPIDLLIGMDHYNDVVLDGVIRQGPGQPVLRQTVFGWVLSGAFKDASTPPREIQCNVATLSSIEKVVKRFWEVEEVECASSPSAEDAEVDEHFRATVSRDDSGRFIVHLPLRPNHSELGNSKKRATRQLLSLENRLEKLLHMRQLYDESMDNYLAKGYMTEIPRMQSDDSNHFYLPHHGVWKPSSTSTKLRVVFNASAKSSSGLSLNDVMRIGPTVQPDLITVLMRFRLHPYAMRCDISQMYLQVKLHEPHADFQRILYRKTTSEPIREYKINRVCFGVASSPYLATRVLNELAETEQGEFPQGSQAVLENFYVDDGLISCPSLSSALTTQSQLIELMAQGGFSLAKWCATHPRLLENVDESSQDPRQLQTSDDSLVEVLGIKYDPQQDSFHFLVGPDFAPLIGTRRVVSSVVARLYDPLGLIGPVITEGKILIQRSWSDKTSGWDTELSPEDQLRWKRFVETLPQLNTLQFPRWVSDIFDPTSTVIHGFADASQEAYGAAVYIVTTGTDSSISSHLLISKSRIAPKGELTIPKLELCAAELCARLVSRVQNDLRIPRAHFWSDSTIVLAWIRSPSEKRGVFVNNHIKKILQATQSNQWRHVSSPDNPADLISRGCTPGDLRKSSLWFHGPA